MGGAIAVHLSVDPVLSQLVVAMIVIDVVEGICSFGINVQNIYVGCRVRYGSIIGNGHFSSLAALHVQI